MLAAMAELVDVERHKQYEEMGTAVSNAVVKAFNK